MNLRFQDHQNRVRSDLAVSAEKRNMAYQRGTLKKVRRKEGEIWVLRYRVTNSTGKRVENVMPIGLVQEFPKDEDARRKADRLGPSVRINDSSLPGRVRFDFLAEHYLRTDFGGDAVRPKLVNTISHVEQIVRAYLIPRFGNEIAEDIKPLDIQRWLKSLHDSNSLAWTTISKMRGVMRRIYKIGVLHEHVVPLHPILAAHLRSWREQSPQTKDGDFVFPSLRACGSVPLSASIFVADHLRPAAKKAGVHIEDGQRFGLHNLRHSLSNWLVNKAKVEPKTVQGILRHSKIQTTLDLCTQEDSDETLAAQGEYLTALGVSSSMVQ